MKIIQMPSCKNCGSIEISEGVIICPKCRETDPTIVYKQFIVDDKFKL